MRKSSNNINRGNRAILAMATGSLLSCGLLANGASYSYVGATGGSWSNAANWNPSTGFPAAGDTGNLGDAAANRTVIYDTGATGALGTLTFAQTDPFLNQLDVQRTTLTITNAVTLSASAGTADFLEDAALGTTGTTTFSAGLQINPGGVLEIQNGQNNTTFQISDIAGATTVNGGVFSVDQTVSTSSTGGAIDAAGSLTVNSGTLEFGVIAPSGLSAGLLGVNGGVAAINKLGVVGNLVLADNTFVTLGTASNKVTATGANIYGAGNISIGALASGSIVPTVGLAGGGTNSLVSDTTIAGGLILRPLYILPGTSFSLINDTIGSKTGTLLTLGSTGTGAPSAGIQFISGGGTIDLALNTNVATTNLPFVGSLGSGSTTGIFAIDAKGKTLNLGTAAETLSTGTLSWALTSSVAGGQINPHLAPVSIFCLPRPSRDV